MENLDVAARAQVLQDVIRVIVDAVNLKNVDINTLNEETPLMNGALDLDSVDILEVVVAIEHHFQVRLAHAEEGRKYFQTIGTIADFVLLKRSVL